MRLALELLSENRRYSALIVLLSLAQGGLSAALIATIARGVTAVGNETAVSIALVFVLLCVAIITCRHGHRYAVTLVTNLLEQKLRARLSSSILSSTLRCIESRRASELISVLTRDVETVSGFVLSLPTLLSNVALLLGALLFLGYVANVWMLLSLTALISAAMFLHARITAANLPVFQKIRDHHARLMRAYQDLVFGIKELKMDETVARRVLDEQIGPESRSIAELNLKTVARHSLGLNVSQIVMYILLGGVIFVYPWVTDISVEVVGTYVMVILFSIGPADSIANIHPLYSGARAAMIHMQQLEEELTTTPDAVTHKEQTSFESFELSNVVYSYPRKTTDSQCGTTIGPISLKVSRGDILFVTGGNGSGKTSLAKLVCGLYWPESGHVRLNGGILRQGQLHAYRQLFSVSFSDAHVPSASIDGPGRQDAQSLYIAEQFGVRALIEGAPDVPMDELSSGQRRRLALFASVTRKRRIYLFDEPAAFLDPQAKAWFYRTLLPQLHENGGTLIVISHDDQYFDAASRVLVLRDGQVITETDTPSLSQAM